MDTNQPIRLGVIGSSNGSALAAADECLIAIGKRVDWVVITDRACGLENWAVAKGHSVHRIAYDDAESFSSVAHSIFDAVACNEVILFYTRRVARPLIEKKRVWNIHPALLPAFSGLHGIKDALNAGVRIFGATLHQVDAGLDTGRIVAQIAAPLSVHLSIREVEHLSYLQKVWLTLVWYECLHPVHPGVEIGYVRPELAIANPGIVDSKLRASFDAFLSRDARLGAQ